MENNSTLHPAEECDLHWGAAAARVFEPHSAANAVEYRLRTWTLVRCANHEAHFDALVIGIDSYLRGIGSLESVTCMHLYFGENLRRNWTTIVPVSDRRLNTSVAELGAFLLRKYSEGCQPRGIGGA
jgi:hypothetical protein